MTPVPTWLLLVGLTGTALVVVFGSFVAWHAARTFREAEASEADALALSARLATTRATLEAVVVGVEEAAWADPIGAHRVKTCVGASAAHLQVYDELDYVVARVTGREHRPLASLDGTRKGTTRAGYARGLLYPPTPHSGFDRNRIRREGA